MINQGDRIRGFSVGGVYLGRFSEKHARDLIRSRHAISVATRSHRIKYIIVRNACLGTAADNIGMLKSTYDEDLGRGKHLTMMKRVDPINGTLVKWDQNLTGQELRDGRILSVKTIAEREARR